MVVEGKGYIAVSDTADDASSLWDTTKQLQHQLFGQGKPIDLVVQEYPNIEVHTALTKGQVVKIIIDAGLDITKLWSCYKNVNKPCGECYHCLEAKKAFEEISYNYTNIFDK